MTKKEFFEDLKNHKSYTVTLSTADNNCCCVNLIDITPDEIHFIERRNELYIQDLMATHEMIVPVTEVINKTEDNEYIIYEIDHGSYSVSFTTMI